MLTDILLIVGIIVLVLLIIAMLINIENIPDSFKINFEKEIHRYFYVFWKTGPFGIIILLIYASHIKFSNFCDKQAEKWKK